MLEDVATFDDVSYKKDVKEWQKYEEWYKKAWQFIEVFATGEDDFFKREKGFV